MATPLPSGTRTCGIRGPVGLLAATGAVTAAAYAAWVATSWLRYGRAEPPLPPEEAEPLLDRFMPEFEVADRHHINVNAPAEITLAAASEMDLFRSPIARAIFRGRELIMGSRPDDREQPAGLLARVEALGWRELAHLPGREIVMGAVTRPWEADVVFRPIPPDDFAAFAEPGFAKIVWTLRADPTGPSTSVFRTETRVTTTDEAARAKFRWYWSLLSPGIRLIRLAVLVPVKREAEARARTLHLAPAV